MRNRYEFELGAEVIVLKDYLGGYNKNQWMNSKMEDEVYEVVSYKMDKNFVVIEGSSGSFTVNVKYLMEV